MSQKNKPVVMQIIPSLQTGGAEKTTVDIANAIIQTGGEVVVVSSGGRLVKEIKSRSVKHVKAPVHRKNPITIGINAVKITKLIYKYEVNVVHVRSRAPAWSALWACRYTNTPLVTTYHGAYSQNNKLKGFYNSVMTKADVIIANSEWTKNLINSRHKNIKGEVVTIYRGTDMDEFNPDNVSGERKKRVREKWGIQKGEVVVLKPARLTEWKSQKDVVEAAEQIVGEYPQCQFVLAGDSQKHKKYEQELKAMIQHKGLTKNVRLVGHCKDMPAAIAVSDVVLSVANKPEAFGRVAVEAQAMRKPVVVTDIGATIETINSKTGWKVKPNNPSQIAETIKKILKMSEKEISQTTKEARKFVMKKFENKQMKTKTINVYNKLIK